jgi:DNA polymerase (family X)
MDKKEIAKIFEEIAIFLELKAENPFRIRAYRNAARTLLSMERDLQEVIQEGTLTEYAGIGSDLAEKIITLAKKGTHPFYEKLKKDTPQGLLELMRIPGLGGKRIKLIYETLKIHSLDELKQACLSGKVARLPRMGKKTEQNILDAITHSESYAKRYVWWDAFQMAFPLLQELRKLKEVKKAEIAGSLRRKMETIGDLDFLVATSNPKRVMDWFTSQPLVEKVLGKGQTKASIRLKGGIQADLRAVPESQFAFALCYFTGSKEHNIRLRERSMKRGWTLNEYGLESATPKREGPFAQQKNISEEDIYKALGLAFIPPELREDLGEIAAAEKGKLPLLVEEKDIRGTLHNHTVASDGRNTLKEMVGAAQKLGWEYLGIADHSKSSFQAHGQSEEQLLEQVRQIKKLNASKQFKTYVFSGLECDILANGSLDFSDDILKELDYVVVSVHNVLRQNEKTMTKRIIRAIENPYATILGHVTGRLLLRREPYALDLPKIIDACIANGTVMELNANPFRLDMDWRFWHNASEKGLLCCINTDAHSVHHLEFLKAGVHMARKGWLEKKHILNTQPLSQIKQFLKKK